ncbi:MAG: HAMP domain-containing histidine kinase [Gammaproteobacteria bacterium]|nr:HAMP domain-containing histidine kinase [Gammaproteobacteria bacterium]
MKPITNSRISYAISKLVFFITLTLTSLYGIFVLGYSWVIEDNIFNRLVAQQVNSIKVNYQNTGDVSVSKSHIYQLFKGWQHVPKGIWQTFEQEPNRVEYSLENGKTYHLARFYIEGEEYVLLADVEGFEVSRDYLTGILIWLFGFSIASCVLVALIGWRMGRKIAIPIEELAGRVKDLKASDLTSLNQLVTQMPNNEIKALAEAIDHSFTQLNEALTREVHFTKDISHEIRTPISVIQNALSQGAMDMTGKLMKNDPICFSAQSVKQMRSAAGKLTQITHVLLALARNESSMTHDVSLNQIIEHCVLNHFGLNHTPNGSLLQLDINMPKGEVVINANKNLLEILINNLLSNVVSHASGKSVELLLQDNSIKLTNEFSISLPEKFRNSGIKAQTSEGIGQGLSLIERICDACGWELDLEINTEQKLFSVVVVFK